MSLLQDLLKSHAGLGPEAFERRFNNNNQNNNTSNADDNDSDEDKFIGVFSLPGTPGHTRPSSPTNRSSSRPLKGPLLLSSSKNAKDPLRRFPTEVSQKIFGQLEIVDLAKCSRVCKKWNRSQSLNYVWFQHYRKENFHDESLPPGKWTRRESKQNWRIVYLKTLKEREPPTSYSRSSYANARSSAGAVASHPHSGATSPLNVGSTSPLQSGQQTPRERREAQWALEAAAQAKPGKLEMREMYKELGGRKAKTKTKVGAAGSGGRDKGGWNDGGGSDW